MGFSALGNKRLMEYQYVTSISAQETVKNFSKTDETAEVGLAEPGIRE